MSITSAGIDERVDPRAGIAAPLAATLASIAAAAALYLRDPHVAGNWPSCPFYTLTGLYCPGCGSMRAAWDVLHLDPWGAIASNPLAALSGALLAITLVASWSRALSSLRPNGWRSRMASLDPLQWRYSSLAFAVAVPVFWLLRNLPWFDFLAP